MLTETAFEDSRLSFWLRVREIAVPPLMIETATARRTAGDWAGACAAAGFAAVPLARAGRGCLVRHSCFVVQSSLPPLVIPGWPLGAGPESIPPSALWPDGFSDVQLHIIVRATRAPE